MKKARIKNSSNQTLPHQKNGLNRLFALNLYVRGRGLEPPHHCWLYHLKVARLPISPSAHNLVIICNFHLFSTKNPGRPGFFKNYSLVSVTSSIGVSASMPAVTISTKSSFLLFFFGETFFIRRRTSLAALSRM